MTIIVNSIFIDEALSPLIGGGDSAEEIDKYSHYKTDEEEDVKRLVREILLPHFKEQKNELKQAVKDSLAYYLNYPYKVNFKLILESMLLPIKYPKDPILFFQWVWEVFFDAESIEYIKNKMVVEEYDVNAVLNLLKGIGN